jgi:hypothetical protein
LPTQSEPLGKGHDNDAAIADAARHDPRLKGVVAGELLDGADTSLVELLRKDRVIGYGIFFYDASTPQGGSILSSWYPTLTAACRAFMGPYGSTGSLYCRAHAPRGTPGVSAADTLIAFVTLRRDHLPNGPLALNLQLGAVNVGKMATVLGGRGTASNDLRNGTLHTVLDFGAFTDLAGVERPTTTTGAEPNPLLDALNLLLTRIEANVRIVDGVSYDQFLSEPLATRAAGKWVRDSSPSDPSLELANPGRNLTSVELAKEFANVREVDPASTGAPPGTKRAFRAHFLLNPVSTGSSTDGGSGDGVIWLGDEYVAGMRGTFGHFGSDVPPGFTIKFRLTVSPAKRFRPPTAPDASQIVESEAVFGTSTPFSSSTPTTAPASGTVSAHVTDALKVRQGPSTATEQLGLIPSGTPISVECVTVGEVVEGTGSWYRVTYEGARGFVSGAFVDTGGSAVTGC